MFQKFCAPFSVNSRTKTYIMKKLFSIVICLLLLQSGFSQSDNSKTIAEWERAKAYTKEYLDAMPEEGYSAKPTPEMRSFAEQMMHLAEANYGIGAMASGKKSPVQFGSLEKSSDKSKAATSKAVLDSYDFVISSIKDLDSAKQGEQIDMFGNKVSRMEAINKAFEHQTHHRGQTTVYLRLKGVTPPQERLF